MVQIHPFKQPQTYGVCCMQPKDIHFGDPNPNNSWFPTPKIANASDRCLQHWFQLPPHPTSSLLLVLSRPNPPPGSKVDIILLPGKNVKKSLKKWKAGSWFIDFGRKNPLKTRLCPTFAHFNAGFRPCDRHAQQGHAILPCDAFTRIVVVDVGHCQFFGLEAQTRLLLVAASLNIIHAPEPVEVPEDLRSISKNYLHTFSQISHSDCHLTSSSAFSGIRAERYDLTLSRSQLLGTQIRWHCQFSTTSAGCH